MGQRLPESLRASAGQWLVSVRDELEMAVAVDYQVDILDFKEPREGPLAPASPQLWSRAIAARELHQSGLPEGERRVFPRLSAALGEPYQALAGARQLPAGFEFAKAGPSRCGTPVELVRLWASLRGVLPEGTELVAVAYADFVAAQTVPPETVFALARESGIRRCLIDTFVKDGRSSLDHLGGQVLASLSQWADQHRQWWTLAGSIRADQIQTLRQSGIQPDCWGVRGDVCDRRRVDPLSPVKMANWKRELKGLH